MKIDVTLQVIDRMINRSKRNFLNSSYFSDEIKKLVKGLRVIVIFNKKLKTTAGQANAITYTEALSNPYIDMRYKRYRVDSCKKFLIIEINKELAQLHSKEEVFDTVSHEFAHCVDFVIRGFHYINGKRRRRGFHDSFWKLIHIAMGGSGNSTL
jgi:hypothetical protein